MMIKTIKVSEKGQIAIPLSIRKQARIKKGDELVIIEEGGDILLQKVKKIKSKFKDDFEDIKKWNEISLKEVWDNEQDEIWSKKLMRQK